MYIDTAFAKLNADPIEVQIAKDAASLLLSASPQHAAAHALAAHELACAGYDEQLTLFWAEVVRILSPGALR